MVPFPHALSTCVVRRCCRSAAPSEFSDDSQCTVSSPVAYCRSLEAALVSVPRSTYVTRVALRGRVSIDHLVIGSAVLQRPIVLYSDPGHGIATLHCRCDL